LAIKLQRASQHPQPKIILEQYTIPADLAAEILFLACYAREEIEGRLVADLGTGTGRLALGASILGAHYVVGIDLDKSALDVAHRNSRELGLRVDWVLGDIESLRGPVDTVLMNPPFGTKRPHADLQFLQVALRTSSVTYSIHKSSTRSYLLGWLRGHDAKAEVIMTTKMEIPHLFSFHRKKRHYVDVDIFRIEWE
jgi:putative methylase